jgi:hypothetical protein
VPTIRGIAGPYRFFFSSLDCDEPEHVHVERDGAVCKFWLEPVSLANHHGHPSRELGKILALVRENRQSIHEAWHEHCSSR